MTLILVLCVIFAAFLDGCARPMLLSLSLPPVAQHCPFGGRMVMVPAETRMTLQPYGDDSINGAQAGFVAIGPQRFWLLPIQSYTDTAGCTGWVVVRLHDKEA